MTCPFRRRGQSGMGMQIATRPGEATMPSNQTPQLQAVAKAVENLTYPSESDEPFDVFQWEGSSNDSALQALIRRAGPGRQVSGTPLVQFFSQLEDSDDA